MRDIVDPPQPGAPQAYLIVADARAAIRFYVCAFEAEIETTRLDAATRRVVHAQLRAFGAPLFLADDHPASGQGLRAPTAIGATTVTLHVELEDAASVDALFARAAAGGAQITFPAQAMDWGAWYGRMLDPFGHAWSFAAPS